MQLALLQPKPFVPMPSGSVHYVAALQNKTGELEALRNASEQTWSRLTPLLHIVGRQLQPPEFRSANISEWVRKLGEAVGTHPFFLDLLRLDPSHPVTTTKGPVPLLERIYWATRRRSLNVVPVVTVGHSTSAHFTLVRSITETDGRGVALRYPIRTLALEASKQQAYLNSVLDAVGTDVGAADLLIDLAYLDPDVDVRAEDLGPAIAGALAVGSWRNVVVFGTSIPSMMSCVPEGTMGTLPRTEWEIWQALRSVGLSRVPAYGDYAIQHPRPPHDVGGGGTMRANIRYTIEDGTLVARGRGPVRQEGNEQYIGLCQELIARAEFAGAGYTWGDGLIDGCARGQEEPGAQNVWRGAGTSHHLRFVTDQLDRLSGAA